MVTTIQLELPPAAAAAAEGEHCILVWHDNTETQLVMVDRNSVYTSSHA